MARLTTAGRLLVELARCGDAPSEEQLALALGLDVERLSGCREGSTRLTPAEQQALAEAVLACPVAPSVARLAHALRGQAEAAARFERQETPRHMIAPPRPF